METIMGLDIGGANLKAALSDGSGWLESFWLWKHPEALAQRLKPLVDRRPADRLVVTMTGELCDCYPTKAEGVRRILQAVQQVADGRPVSVWSTAGGFLSPEQAADRTLEVAAANWHALATWVARHYGQGLSVLVDVGSTTTDVVRLYDGRVVAQGKDDQHRLRSGELVYLGVRRTPLMALGPTVTIGGGRIGVVAEAFADTADVFTVLGDLQEDPDDCQTADGQPRTVEACAARLVRMVGADRTMMDVEQARELAEAFAVKAIRRIADAAFWVCFDEEVNEPRRYILSGSGSFLAREALLPFGDSVELVELAERISPEASTSACAYALARLSVEGGLPSPPPALSDAADAQG
jgi:probable H4MPT-linked C1 transfer pathway protein